MSAKTSTSRLFVHYPQYIRETTEGTTPTTGSTTLIQTVNSISLKIDGAFVDVAQVGPEDLITIIAGMKTFESQIKGNLINSTFIKHGINAANYASPTGTISDTLSIVFSIYLNGTTNYIVMAGSRPKSCALSMAVGQATEYTMDFVHTSIATPTTTAPTGLTLDTTTPSGAVWSWLDGGANPVGWNGGQLCKSFNVTFDRGTSVDHVLGQVSPYSSQPHGRRISGDMSILWTATSLETDIKAETARTLTATLKTGTSTLTLTGSKLVSLGRDNGAEDTEGIVEQYGFRSLAGSIT